MGVQPREDPCNLYQVVSQSVIYFSLVVLDELNRMLNESAKQILLSRLGLSGENTHLLEAVIFQRRMLEGGT